MGPLRWMAWLTLLAALGISAANLGGLQLSLAGAAVVQAGPPALTATPAGTAIATPGSAASSITATPPATALAGATQEAEAAGLEKEGDSRSTPEAESAAPATILRTEWSADGKTLYIRVEGARQLYAVDLQLTFDASRYQVADTDPARSGVQIKPGEAPVPDFVAANKADNQQGVVRYVATQLGAAPGFSGDGLVATVLWRRSVIDRNAVALGPVLMVDSEAQPIQVELK